MPTNFTIPQTTLSAGVDQTFTSPNIPAASPGYKLVIQQVSWAHSGGDALHVWLDASYDGGTNWLNLTDDLFQDETQPADKGHPLDAFVVVASLSPEVGGVARKLRARTHPVKTVTISGTITAL